MAKSNVPRPSPPRWWLSIGEETQGPFTLAQILDRLRSGASDGSTLACLENSDQWRMLSEWPQFRGSLPSPTTISDDDEVGGTEVEESTTSTSASTRPLSEFGVGSKMDPDLKRFLTWGAVFLVAAIFFGAGPLKGCVPGGCRYKSEQQQRLEELRDQRHR